MAKATLETTKKYKLELDEEEATWLMNVIQNPLSISEASIETNMRSSIFIALKEAKVSQ